MIRKKIEYTEEDFIYLEKELTAMGFREITERNFKNDFQRLDLAIPRKITGREVGFQFTENTLTVKVWTTYIKKDKKFRDTGEDMAWVLITQGDTAQYYARPIKRTRDFIKHILSKAWITQFKVKNRPLCTVCKAHMQIQHNDTRRTYYWGCRKIEKHTNKQPYYLGWDSVGKEGKLPPKAQEYLNEMRSRVAAYKAKDKKKGIVRTPARKIRKRWEIGNPENKVTVKV